ACLAPLNRGGLNSTHFHATRVPVEEPSTASKADMRGATRDVRFGSLADISFEPKSKRAPHGGLSKIRSGVLSSRLRSDAYFSNRWRIWSRADAGIDAWRGSMTIA